MKSSVEKAYRHIHRAILMGQINPDGRLREVSIARELAISRTPVREAICLLEKEGLVVRTPNCGASLRIPDAVEAEHLYELRKLIESHSAAQAALRITAADLLLLRGHLDSMRSVARIIRDAALQRLEGELDERWRSSNMAFHEVILKASGNPAIAQAAMHAQMITRLFQLNRRYPLSNTTLLRTLVEVCLIHYRILKALTRHDPESARRAMSRHMEYARHDVRNRINPA